MMQIAAWGRLGQDPRPVTTTSGKAMTVGSLAVTLTDRNGDESTEWLGIIAFGGLAEKLAKHGKGDCVSVIGRAQRNTYTGRDGTERNELQIVCDGLVSARTPRPGGSKAKRAPASSSSEAAPAGPPEFNDDIPF